MRKSIMAISVSTLLTIAGCGGGGGGSTTPAGGTAKLKLSSIPFEQYSTLAGVYVRVGMPAGTSLATTGGIPQLGVIKPSGVVASSGSFTFGSYTAPTSSTPGALKFFMAAGDNSFKKGEFATVDFSYSAAQPASTSFIFEIVTGTAVDGNQAVFKNVSGATLQVVP